MLNAPMHRNPHKNTSNLKQILSPKVAEIFAGHPAVPFRVIKP
jgi:hypothetical protein